MTVSGEVGEDRAARRKFVLPGGLDSEYGNADGVPRHFARRSLAVWRLLGARFGMPRVPIRRPAHPAAQTPPRRRPSPTSPEETVILPYWEARHPDHYHASTLGYEACFLAGLKAAPLEGEPHTPLQDPLCHFLRRRPSPFVVDITAQYSQRHKAILAFASQFRTQKVSPPRLIRNCRLRSPSTASRTK